MGCLHPHSGECPACEYERGLIQGAKAERARVVAIVDEHLADLRTAHASAVVDASPHWVRTIENMIDSVTVLRGRIERGDWKPSTSGGG